MPGRTPVSPTVLPDQDYQPGMTHKCGFYRGAADQPAIMLPGRRCGSQSLAELAARASMAFRMGSSLAGSSPGRIVTVPLRAAHWSTISM
jgi:hypothetical protein